MLQVKNLSHSYKLSNKSQVDILCDINFSLPSKGIVFITGKSGCGKTTLLNILEGILKPTSGDVIFNGVDIYKNKKFNFSKYNGVLFQNYNLIDNLTVFENLKITADLKEVDYKVIHEKLADYGLEDFKDTKIENLSGGEKQRVAFIRAILNSPEIIFCDEPTGAIDEENASILMNDLRKLSEKSLVIIVTHNKDLINQNDFIIEIKEGKISQNINFISEKPSKVIQIDKKIKRKKNYLSLLSIRLLNKSSFKHVLYVVSMFFSILFIELTLGLTFGLKNQNFNLEYSYQNYNRFKISERQKRVETGSPIKLIKEVRPDKSLVVENLKCFKDAEVYNNYSYFLNGNNMIYSGSQELKNIKIELSYNIKNEVVINDILYDLLEDKKANISLELNQFYNYKVFKDETLNKVYEEKFYFSKFFKPKSIKKEFSYLNNPTIYLPLEEFELFLQKTYLEKYFNETKEIKTWFDILETADKDDPITSYSYDFYFEDNEQTNLCYKLIDTLNEDNKVKIMNEPHFYVSSFLQIADILSIGLIAFSILSIIITFSLLFFIVISLYLQERKEIAVLKVLGSRNEEINSIFNNTMILETIFSFIIGTLLSLFLTKIFNKTIYKYLGVLNLISTPNFTNNLTQILIIILSLFIFILFVIIVNYLAIKNASKKSIALELREE